MGRNVNVQEIGSYEWRSREQPVRKVQSNPVPNFTSLLLCHKTACPAVPSSN